jgi:hypothetical protein
LLVGSSSFIVAFKGAAMHSKIARSRFTLRFAVASPCWRWLLLAVVLLCPSCSNGLNKVRGKVTYDGQLIKGAVVAFHPKDGNKTDAFHPTGITDENGVFTLNTQNDAGAPVGEYRVTVIWYDESGESADKSPKRMGGLPDRPDRLKGRYADPEKSGLTAVITSGNNEIPAFELKKVD